MSTEIMVPADDNVVLTTEVMDTSGPPVTESGVIMSALNNSIVELTNGASGLNATKFESEYTVFKIFVILEIIMTTLELVISMLVATLMPRWRKNYRNQMLMQLTLARFIKRVIFIFQFLEHYDKIPSTFWVTNMLNCFQFYTDFVIVILVFFFIKHMYNSLIIVIVKISQNNFYRVLICSWLIPVPVSAVCIGLIITDLVDRWLVYLLICSIFRWPLILIGTGLYIIIVYRVFAEKIRQFASSLVIVTFLLCLILNIYLFSKDISELFFFESFESFCMISFVSGFLLNLLILSLYILLISFSINQTQASRLELPDYSLAEAKCENIYSIDKE